MDNKLMLKRLFLTLLVFATISPGMCCKGGANAAKSDKLAAAAGKASAAAPAPNIPEADIFTCTSPGQWFPDNPVELRKMIDGFLAKADKKNLPGRIVAIISPHAGYQFSGPVAAYSYKQLEGLKFDTVIVVGFTHHVDGRDVAVYNKGGFRTPLGVIPVDTKMSDALIKADAHIKYIPAVFSGEHSLDAQLPFLQRTLGDFKLVPILITGQTRETIDAVAKAIPIVAKGKNVLLVASSDMSHFWSHEEAQKLDKEVLDKILTLDHKGLVTALAGDYEGRRLCGHGAVKTVMRAAVALGADKANLLKYADSQDTYGPTGNGVVGYGAIALTSAKGKNQTAASPKEKERAQFPGELDKKDKKRLLQIAREGLEEYYKTGNIKEFTNDLPRLENKRGVFVTLNENGDLRGCIGHFENDVPLYQLVPRQTIISATQDPRFNPVTAAELDKITIEISVLSVPQPVKSYEDIKVGMHGVIMHKDGCGATFLPQVAPEQGWDRDTMLTQLSQKAGLDPDAWKSGATFEVYTAQVFGEGE